jgi:hypothetical protein
MLSQIKHCVEWWVFCIVQKCTSMALCFQVSTSYCLWTNTWRGVNVLDFFFIWSWEGQSWWCRFIIETRDFQGANQTLIDEVARCPWRCHFLLIISKCCNPSFGLATKARAYKGAGQEWIPRVTFHAPKSVGKCEGMNPHTPKWTPKRTPTLGVRAVDCRIFRRQFKGSKLIGWKFPYAIVNLLKIRCLKWARVTHLAI